MEKNKQSIELANELFSALEEMINCPISLMLRSSIQNSLIIEIHG